MGNFRKCLASSLILLLALSSLSLMMVKTVHAQSTSTLSPPEFTVKFVDRSYTVPVTTQTTTNPYTGQQVTTSEGGYLVTNYTIDVTIKNLPFTTVQLPNGTSDPIYYGARSRGHFDTQNDDWWGPGYGPVQESNSGYTVITFVVGYDWEPPAGGQIDFEVQAEAGSFYYGFCDNFDVSAIPSFAILAQSDWSAPQTITMPGASSSNSPNPIQPPTSSTQSTATSTPIATLSNSPYAANNPSKLPLPLTTVITIVGIAVLLTVIAVLLLQIKKLKNRTAPQELPNKKGLFIVV
jgi:hypothetical protein